MDMFFLGVAFGAILCGIIVPMAVEFFNMGAQ